MTLNEQFATMIAMILTGLWIGVSLTTYHRFMHPNKKWMWTTIPTDIFFWICQGLLIFYVLLKVNEGQIRFYIFLALLLGYVMYKGIFERLYAVILERFIVLVVSVCRFLKKCLTILLILPLLTLLKLVLISCKMILKFIKAILYFLFCLVFYPLKWVYIFIVPKRVRQKGEMVAKKVGTLWAKLIKIFKRTD
ncbi:spore cortex biosynthesis protein YabQ [Terrilactibacillus laevilacticus]|uniref:Spore cortex biosynthesis protein YabQ n=1 Tax=Terrilactibacillus laevilacticus TaxID=1380157 RepID=A0ABW5PRM4_9BACI|nr:spore cortex biosynthesis protein YabQ [Terrilactibacillus laevilacticus]